MKRTIIMRFRSVFLLVIVCLALASGELAEEGALDTPVQLDASVKLVDTLEEMLSELTVDNR